MKKLILYLIVIFLISCSGDKDSDKDSNPAPKLGDTYKGGVIFYILKDGDPNYIEGETHGFITKEEFDDTYIWGCNSVYGLSDDLGDGQHNTELIASSCDQETASSICLDEGWYLPNANEMEEMVHNKLIIGITSGVYWTSSAFDHSDPYVADFGTGEIDFSNVQQFHEHKVKPIKRF